jgi:hypothetical protein
MTDELKRAKSDEYLAKMRPRTRQALITLMESAYAQTEGARMMLENDEGAYSSGEHHDLRELLGAACQGLEAVIDVVTRADVRAVMGATDDVLAATSMLVAPLFPPNHEGLSAARKTVEEARYVKFRANEGLAYEAHLIDEVVGDLAPLKGAENVDKITTQLTCIAERLRLREQKARALDLAREADVLYEVLRQSGVNEIHEDALKGVADRLMGKL